MTALIFHTPSRNCPLRKHNGARVIECAYCGKRYVRRLGKRAVEYVVKIEGVPHHWLALEDELFIEPEAT